MLDSGDRLIGLESFCYRDSEGSTTLFDNSTQTAMGKEVTKWYHLMSVMVLLNLSAPTMTTPILEPRLMSDRPANKGVLDMVSVGRDKGAWAKCEGKLTANNQHHPRASHLILVELFGSTTRSRCAHLSNAPAPTLVTN